MFRVLKTHNGSWRCFCHFSRKYANRQDKHSPAKVYVPEFHYFRPERFPGLDRLAQQQGLKTYRDFYKFSLEKNDLFWGTVAEETLSWQEPFHTVQDCDLNEGKINWFVGGKLNASENCLDRHAHTDPDKVALIWERDEPGNEEHITYSHLLELTCRLANVLKDAGVKKGDRVCIYLPTSPMVVASMLACARIGAVHTLVFAGFSAESLRDRIQDSQAKVVITADQSSRGGKVIPLKKIVEDAVKGCPSVKRILVQQRASDSHLGRHEIPLDKAMADTDKRCKPEQMDSEDPLFILYTSGSTGKPKGIVHTHGGYLTYAALTHQVCFNYKPGDIFGCLADIGWITGHTYIAYGPLLNGGTTVLYESTPNYPDPGRYWETVQRLRINQLYISPTAIRLLLGFGDKHVQKYDRSSLVTLGVVGEPINHEAWEWYYNIVGERRCPIVDTWWQTETGGIAIAPLPADKEGPIHPSMAMRPFFGIEPEIKKESDKREDGNQGKHLKKDANEGHDLKKDDKKGKDSKKEDKEGEDSEKADNEGENSKKDGALLLRRAWPGMMRGVWGDKKRFREAYFSQHKGTYFTGDGATLSTDGYYRITGRIDDVINISGHRIGTAEVEDAINSHTDIGESAVISFPHGVKGEGLAAFVVLREGKKADNKTLVKDLKDLIKKKIAGYAIPEEIMVVKGLPKTRSGKIMRRILKKVAAGDSKDVGDVSTLSNPDSVKDIIEKWSDTHTHTSGKDKTKSGKDKKK